MKSLIKSPIKTLSISEINESVIIYSVIDCHLKSRLMEMGLVVGKEVKVIFKAPMGDPIAVNVGGYILAIRLDEAALIIVI